jgi:hypothetical protein
MSRKASFGSTLGKCFPFGRSDCFENPPLAGFFTTESREVGASRYSASASGSVLIRTLFSPCPEAAAKIHRDALPEGGRGARRKCSN